MKAICYINFLDSSNKFKPMKKEFKTKKDAINFMIKTFDKIDNDMINFY